MKFTAMFGAVVLIAAMAWADMTVVQEVESSLTSDKPTAITMTMLIKGQKAIIDFKPEPRSSLIDLQAGKIYLIDHTSKQVMIMSLDQMKLAMEMASKAMTAKKGQMSIQKTENIKTIKGFKCREYTLGSGGTQASCWMAEDVDAREIEPFRMFAMDVAKMFGQETLAQMKGMMIAMDSTMTLQGKKVKNRMAVQSVSREAIADSVFTVPSDYKSLEMPTMPLSKSAAPIKPGVPKGK